MVFLFLLRSTMAKLLTSSFLFLFLATSTGKMTLKLNFYDKACPQVESMVRKTMSLVTKNEARMGASILRLFFHDCFVQGCDGSILLDDTPSFLGEKGAAPNNNSVRGFEVIEKIKSQIEGACPGIVSCADIIALAARDAVVLLGGPSWAIPLGRRDSIIANRTAANTELPSPLFGFKALVTSFASKGLSAIDLTALSGAHTIGQSHCKFFRPRLPCEGGLAPLDVQTPQVFDNRYYQNLHAKKGALESDQVLYDKGSQGQLVKRYSGNTGSFFTDFTKAMVKMGNISPLTGTKGEIRKICSVVN